MDTIAAERTTAWEDIHNTPQSCRQWNEECAFPRFLEITRVYMQLSPCNRSSDLKVTDGIREQSVGELDNDSAGYVLAANAIMQHSSLSAFPAEARLVPSVMSD